MLLRPLTAGKVSGTGTVTLESRILGGVLITTDNTNAAAVVVRATDSSGAKVFDLSTLSPGFHIAPLQAAAQIYYDISGTGASAMLFEWVE